MRILIVGDDPQLGLGLQAGLRREGLAADWVKDGDAAEHALRMDRFDLLVLDPGLPDRDGLALLRKLRDEGVSIPVLILTAREAVSDLVAGPDAGADDYLAKPFNLDEVSGRIRALARKSRTQPAPLLRAGDLKLDRIRRRVTIKNRQVSLSRKEYALLEALIDSPDQAVSRARLQASAYDWKAEIESNAIEVHIHNLRRKIGRDRILTVRGIGYQVVSKPGA